MLTLEHETFIPEEILSYVKAKLKTKRYIHTTGVAYVAKRLAEAHHAPVDKAVIAAYCHDVGKHYSLEDTRNILLEHGEELSNIERNSNGLMHARLGAILIQDDLGIKDPEIIGAVRWHTTGSPGMTTLEEILYCSDHLDPGREISTSEEILAQAESNLQLGVLLVLIEKMTYVLKKKQALHPKSVEAYNYYTALTASK